MTLPLRAVVVLTLALAFLPPTHLAAQQSGQGGNLEIVGNTRLGEQGTGSWGVTWRTPPTRQDGGIQPPTPGWDQQTIAAEWEDPPEYRWDFGDGTPPVETGMRSGVTHQYLQDGTYTIRLTATSGDASETATLDVAVLNRAPRVLGIQSPELPSAEAMVDLSTKAQDTPEDVLEVRWDFGDGEMDAGTDLWTTTHAYDEPGTYQVVVEVSDDQDAQGRDRAGDHAVNPKERRSAAERWCGRRRTSVLRGLLVRIPEPQQHRLGERPTHELQAHRKPVGGEACGNGERGEADGGAEEGVRAREVAVVGLGIGEDVGGDQGGRTIEGGVDDRVEVVISHRLEDGHAQPLATLDDTQVPGVVRRLADHGPELLIAPRVHDAREHDVLDRCDRGVGERREISVDRRFGLEGVVDSGQ